MSGFLPDLASWALRGQGGNNEIRISSAKCDGITVMFKIYRKTSEGLVGADTQKLRFTTPWCPAANKPEKVEAGKRYDIVFEPTSEAKQKLRQ